MTGTYRARGGAMASITEEVVSRCTGAQAYTLECGYAVHPGNRIVHFPPIRVLEQRRDPSGRCTYLYGRYPDGSRLRFTYSRRKGAELVADQGIAG